MADHQDVELRIRATNYSKQPMEKVVDALKEMTKAQDAQIESAKKGTTNVTALEASYEKLASATKALVSQHSLTKLYEEQSKTLAELKTKIDAARAAQKAYSDSLPVGAKRTKDQQDELNNLGRALKRVERDYLRTEANVGKTAQRMGEFGITAANLTASQQKIRDAVTAANAALERQERAISATDANAARRVRDAAATAQAERLANAEMMVAQATRDATAALNAKVRAQRESAQAQAMTDAAEAAELERIFSVEATKAAAALKRKNDALAAQQTALRAAADQAERLMRASLVQARGRTPVQTPDLAGQIRDIANPADAAVRSVSGIENALVGLERRVREIRGPVRDYRGALEEAKRAQQALQTVAGQVDAYQRQIAAVRAARYEYGQSRRAVSDLVAQMRAGATGDDITTRLAQAQRTMQQAAANLGNLTTQARASRLALQQAGVDTRNLTQAEADLVAQANRATQSLNALTEAHRRNGAAADSAGSRIFNWFGGANGRQSLSYAQRLRGEVLSLTASFVGLNAAVGLGRSTLDSYKANQAITSRLLIATGGDARQAAEDFAYLEKQADRIGFVFQKIAPAYTKFAIAAKSANFTTQETRFVFENIAESAVKARLSTEELEGIFKAFEQIMSKGTVQAEELRGQLGDRLPGAFQIAARAMNKTVEEYTKLLELGQVPADQVIGIARELGKTYGAVSESTENLLVAEARFTNAANRFRTATAEAGFAQAYTDFLNRMTTLLDGGEGDRLARALSDGFVAVIGVVETLVNNIDALKLAIGGLVAIGLVRWLVGLPALYRAVASEVVLLNGVLVTMNTNMGVRGAAAAATLAAGATGLTGVMARLTLGIAAASRALLVFYRLIPLLGLGILAIEGVSYALDKIDDKIRSRFAVASREATKAQVAFNDATRAVEEADNAEELARAKKHQAEMLAVLEKALAARAAALSEANKKNVDLSSLMPQLEGEDKLLNPEAGTEDPGNRPEDVLKRLRKDLEREDERSARNLRSARLRSAKEELKDRLAIVDETFDLRRDAAKREIKDKEKLEEALSLIEASSQKAQDVERQRFNNEQASKSQEAGDKRIRMQEAVNERLARIQDDLANREGKADVTIPFEQRRAAAVQAVSKAYRELENDIVKIAKFNPQQAAADLAHTMQLEAQHKLLAGQNADRAEAERLAKEFENTLTILKTQLEEINALYDNGLISMTELEKRTLATISSLGPGVQVAGEAALEFAERFRSIMDPVAYQTLVSGIRSSMAGANTEAATAVAKVTAQQSRLNALLDERAAKEAAIKKQRELGLIGSTQEAEMLNANTDEYKQSIIETIAELQRLLDKTQEVGGMSEEAYRKATAAASQMTLETKNGIRASNDLDKVIVNSVASNGVTAFEALATSIAEVASGAKSIGEGFRGALSAVGLFFAKLLQDIAVAIIRQMILNTLVKSLGAASGIGGAAAAAGGSAAGGTLFHGGGVVGRGRGVTRDVPREAFANAMRYHTGGLAGFRPNEVPAILERNEEVLTRDDPRHVLNGGKAGGTDGGGADAGTRVVVVDDRQAVPEAMNSSAGEKVIIATIKNNAASIKSMLRN